MRSPERRRAWAAVALALTGVGFAALAAWAMVERSTIPARLDGTVTVKEVGHEKHPGVDDAWFVAVGRGGPRHVDRAVADLLHEGDRVQKTAWDRTLRVNGENREVALSRDARRMLALAPVIAVIAAALAVGTGSGSRIRRPRRRPNG